MKKIQCTKCGVEDLYQECNFMICRYCGTRFSLEKSDRAVTASIKITIQYYVDWNYLLRTEN